MFHLVDPFVRPMLNDREKVNRPNSQLGFIEFLIIPLTESFLHIFHRFDDLAVNLSQNFKHWSDEWVDEVKHSEDAVAKAEARVARIQAKLHGLVREER